MVYATQAFGNQIILPIILIETRKKHIIQEWRKERRFVQSSYKAPNNISTKAIICIKIKVLHNVPFWQPVTWTSCWVWVSHDWLAVWPRSCSPACWGLMEGRRRRLLDWLAQPCPLCRWGANYAGTHLSHGPPPAAWFHALTPWSSAPPEKQQSSTETMGISKPASIQ